MADLITEPPLLTGGEWIRGGGPECEVEDPATEQVTGIAGMLEIKAVQR